MKKWKQKQEQEKKKKRKKRGRKELGRRIVEVSHHDEGGGEIGEVEGKRAEVGRRGEDKNGRKKTSKR